ncbi:MAG TPA: hypothetical protein VFK73_06945 [Paludibacter sp.]|nr:hypothetical protein [Paludibacter sp.]
MYKHIVILTGEQYKELMSNLRDDNYSITKRLHKIASEVGYDPNAYGWYNSCVTPVDGQCIIVWNSYASCD